MTARPGITLPRHVSATLARLDEAGFEAVVVGGCVRDSLLGKRPSDWDIATAALPQQVQQVFSDRRLVETGLRHGTLTLVLEEGPLEITTYRIDGEYTDHRHPREVAFTPSLGEDLARRDFTVNAMAYHPSLGLVDPFGGRHDLRGGRIRAVGDPDRRFSEDALRILRGLRFASVLGFAIDPHTARSMKHQRRLLRDISPERIQAELVKLLVGKGAERVLHSYADILWQILPELAPMAHLAQGGRIHRRTLWDHTLHSLTAVPPTPVLRLTMLLHGVAKPGSFALDEQGVGHFLGHAQRSADIAGELLSRLRFDRATIRQVRTLIRWHSADLGRGRPAVRRWLGLLGEENLRQLLLVKRADILAQEPTLAAPRLRQLTLWEQELARVLEEPPCYRIHHLAVDGRALLAAGIPAGPELGQILEALLEEVIEERLPNEAAALLSKAVELHGQAGKR